MNKTGTIILVVVIAAVLIGAGVWYYASSNNNQTPSAPVAGAGEHCGGNMLNAPMCGAGYQCMPEPSSTLPFGDVGGICVAVQAQGGY